MTGPSSNSVLRRSVRLAGPTEPGSPRVAMALDLLLGLNSLAALTTLVLLYGFGPHPAWPAGTLGLSLFGREWLFTPVRFLQTAVCATAGYFVLDRVLRLFLARESRQYFRLNWVDFAMIAVAGAAIPASLYLLPGHVAPDKISFAVMQVYVVFALVLRAVGINIKIAESGIHPLWLLIGSFATLCLIGAGLLMLPSARTGSAPQLWFIDALFTSTSAVCVTGLTVRNIGADFTPLGQAVILCLIQAGGLGIMIFGTTLALLVGRGLSMKQSNTLGAMLSANAHGDLGKLAMFVVAITLLLEAVGAILLYPMFLASIDASGHALGAGRAAWFSVFHSVSAFCNAGFSLYGDNLVSLRNHWQVMGAMAPLVILGGLGFPVLQDVWSSLRSLLHRAFHRRADGSQMRQWAKLKLSLHSKIVLTTSVVLIVLGAAALLVTESSVLDKKLVEKSQIRNVGSGQNDWATMTDSQRIRESLFLSICARTAGFNTTDVSQLSDAGKAVLCGLMMIGGSPASTAGGMKTVTFALLVMIVISNLRLRGDVETFRRSISPELVQRVITLGLLYLTLVILVTLVLCVTMKSQGKFIDMLFEACSACGTVGLSTGVTATLNVPAKADLILGMFLGRVGPMTLLLALTAKLRHVNFTYPRENLTIG